MSGWQRQFGGLMAAGALVVGAGVGMGACSKSSTTDTSSATTSAPGSTEAPGASTPGTSEPGTSTPAISTPDTSASPATSTSTTEAPTPTTAPTTPEEFAAELYRAWRAGDADAAAKVASPEAVQSLFAYEPTDFTLQDCQGAAGSTICTYTSGVGTIEMLVRNPTGGLPVLVTGVKVTLS